MLHLYFVFILWNAQQLFHVKFQQTLIPKVKLWLWFRVTYPMLIDHSVMNTGYYVVTTIAFVMNIFFLFFLVPKRFVNVCMWDI